MPIVKSETAEMDGVLSLANAMAVAARTAPKARGDDAIETLIIYGDELESLAQAMEEHGIATKREEAFKRDASNVRKSHAVVLIGTKDLRPKKPNKPVDCGACGHASCAGFLKAKKIKGKDYPGPICFMQCMDLGTALSSACALAARYHVDNRVMWTVGAGACVKQWMQSEIIIGIPLSSSGKNIYFDRA